MHTFVTILNKLCKIKLIRTLFFSRYVSKIEDKREGVLEPGSGEGNVRHLLYLCGDMGHLYRHPDGQGQLLFQGTRPSSVCRKSSLRISVEHIRRI